MRTLVVGLIVGIVVTALGYELADLAGLVYLAGPLALTLSAGLGLGAVIVGARS